MGDQRTGIATLAVSFLFSTRLDCELGERANRIDEFDGCLRGDCRPDGRSKDLWTAMKAARRAGNLAERRRRVTEEVEGNSVGGRDCGGVGTGATE
jgi:hypothetical protein